MTYSLRPPRRNVPLEMEHARTAFWRHDLDFTWLVASQESIQALYARLAPFLASTDLILIVPVGPLYMGWLPQDAWTWLMTVETSDPSIAE